MDMHKAKHQYVSGSSADVLHKPTVWDVLVGPVGGPTNNGGSEGSEDLDVTYVAENFQAH